MVMDINASKKLQSIYHPIKSLEFQYEIVEESLEFMAPKKYVIYCTCVHQFKVGALFMGWRKESIAYKHISHPSIIKKQLTPYKFVLSNLD